MARNRCIGRDNGLPWHVPEDLRHFRAVTTGHAIIMGRRTHESIGRALPQRRNIVVTSQPEAIADGCETAATLDEALRLARTSDPCPRIIGGARMFEEALPLATELQLTEIDRDVPGDTFFPSFDRTAWDERARVAGKTPGVTFLVLARRDPSHVAEGSLAR